MCDTLTRVAQDIGRLIREARERADLSQEELGARVGRSRSAVNAWENGRAVPQRSIAKLEDVLGVKLPRRDSVPDDDDVTLDGLGEDDGPGPDAPEIVRANWGDDHVRNIWAGLPATVSAAQRLLMVSEYLDARDDGEQGEQPG